MTTIASYFAVVNDLDRWRTMTVKTPDVALETKYFKENAAKATTIDAFLKDRRLFNFAMKAYGLGDMTFAVGMMRKVLEQGVSDPKALANTLNNLNIRAFARAFDFKGAGAGVMSSETLISDVSARYVDQAMRASQGEKNPGVELALYFREKAPKITSVLGILADRKLLQVVQTALGISERSSAQPIDTQARLLKGMVNTDDFKDPKKLTAFIARFSAMYDMKNAGTDSQSAVASNAILFSASRIGSSEPIGVDFSLILRMQTANQRL